MAEISCEDHSEETFNYFRRYHMTLHANQSVTGAVFALIFTCINLKNSSLLIVTCSVDWY